MSKTKILLEGMGINPLEKIDNNRDSYWTLYELIDHCREQLSIPRVVVPLVCDTCKQADMIEDVGAFKICKRCWG